MEETSIKVEPTSPIDKDREICKLWNQMNVLWRRFDQFSVSMKKNLEHLEERIIDTDERNRPLMEAEFKKAELESMEKEARQLIEDAAKATKEEGVAPI